MTRHDFGTLLVILASAAVVGGCLAALMLEGPAPTEAPVPLPAPTSIPGPITH